MSFEREEAEVALIKARTGLARSCDYAVVALYLFFCAFGGFTFFGLLGERQTACAYWKSLEAKCHDDACLLKASTTRPWGCASDPRSP